MGLGHDFIIEGLGLHLPASANPAETHRYFANLHTDSPEFGRLVVLDFEIAFRLCHETGLGSWNRSIAIGWFLRGTNKIPDALCNGACILDLRIRAHP